MPESKQALKLSVSGHPVLAHKITILRSSETRPGTFRAVLREVTYHLAYEATQTLSTRPIDITVPVPGTDDHNETKECVGHKLKEHIALVPILRSGLGMTDAMLELVPNAAVHHIGMYKSSSADHKPIQYFNRLPRKCTANVAYILDPLIQTSSTVMSVISILKKWGVEEIHVVSVICSQKGLDQIMEAHPDVYVTVGAVDQEMTKDGNVLPGMGDAGDRQFDTDPMMNDEELLHPSKRKRTMD